MDPVDSRRSEDTVTPENHAHLYVTLEVVSTVAVSADGAILAVSEHRTGRQECRAAGFLFARMLGRGSLLCSGRPPQRS